MAQHIELNPVSHLTIGTVGEPGNRTFYLQGGRGSDVVSVIIEKVQAAALADSLEELLQELKKDHPRIQNDLDQPMQLDLRLLEPIDPLFRVGNLGLGFNEDLWRIIIVAYELVGEDEEPNLVSYWAAPGRIQLFIGHTRQVVKAGRPICGNCGQPIDPDGHFCPHRNGYKR